MYQSKRPFRHSSQQESLLGRVSGLIRRILGRILPDHKSLKGYLHRRTILHIGRLHIRLHRILSADNTPFLHSHPFSYLSLILWGGYSEQVEISGESVYTTYGMGSCLLRPSSLHHRLEQVMPGTLTLFITWKRADNAWSLRQAAQPTASIPWVNFEPGVYLRRLYGKMRFCKFDTYWHVAGDTEEAAWQSARPSIDQSTPPLEKCA